MRHRIRHKKLNRTSAHRRALRRNLAQSLFEHGQICTTVSKAKDVRPFAEKLITLAKKARGGSITARRQIHKLLSDRSIVPAEHQEDYDLMSDTNRHRALRSASGRRYRTGQPKGKLAFTGETVIHRLIDKVAANYEDRPGGYTRLIHLAERRIGDHSQKAILQLVGEEEAPGPGLARPKKSARRRRADARYAFAAKVAKQQKAQPAKDGADAE